jgi:hypothetical protein
MNDDFLAQFRRPPRPEFAAALYQKINLPRPAPARSWPRRLFPLSVPLSPVRGGIVASLILLMLAVLAVTFVPAVQAAVIDLLQEIVLGPNTTVFGPLLGASGRTPAPLATDTWLIRTDIGNFTGNSALGIEPIVRSVGSLDQAQALAGFPLKAPGTLPPGYRLQEVKVAPMWNGTWAFLFYRGPYREIVIAEMPGGPQPGQSPTEVARVKTGVLTDSRSQEVDFDGRPAAWIGGHSLLWEANGVSFEVGGLGLDLEGALAIAGSLGAPLPEATPQVPLAASPAPDLPMNMWYIYTDIGGFGGNTLPGVDPSVRSVSSLEEAQALVGYALKGPIQLPAGYALREVKLAPPWKAAPAFLFYSGPGHDIIIVEQPVGSQPSQDPNTQEQIAVQTMSSAPVKAVDFDGRPAAWVGRHSLQWELDGISYSVGGLDLDLKAALTLARSIVSQAPLPADFTPEPLPTLPSDMWLIRTDIGNFGGDPASDAEPTVRSVSSLAEAQALVTYTLKAPAELPAGYALREVKLAPLGPTAWTFLFYGGPGHDIVIVEMPANPNPNVMTKTMTDGPVKTADFDGHPASWQGGNTLLWEADGISFDVGGLDLDLAEALKIARSLH